VVDLDSMEELEEEVENSDSAPPKKLHDNTPAMTDQHRILGEKQRIEKGAVKYHRSIIHRNMGVLRKFVMGLAPGTQYGCRVRAENEVRCVVICCFYGFISHWSLCLYIYSLDGACGVTGQDPMCRSQE